MPGVFAAFVFDAEIVDDKSKLDCSCLVYPEAGHQLALVVPILVQAFLEQLICN